MYKKFNQKITHFTSAAGQNSLVLMYSQITIIIPRWFTIEYYNY